MHSEPHRADLRLACKEALAYSKFVWLACLMTSGVGAIIGVIPFALLLRGSADSLVSNPRPPGGVVPLAPDGWSEDDADVVDKPVFLAFWSLKYFWCVIAEYVPVSIALLSNVDKSDAYKPVSLCVLGVITTFSVNMWKLSVESNGIPLDDTLVTTLEVMTWAVNIGVNTVSMLVCTEYGFRCSAFLPAVGLSCLCPLLHILVNMGVDIYMTFPDQILVRLFVCGALMSCLRPVTVEVVLILTKYVPALRGTRGQAWLCIYISTSIMAVVQLLQVSANDSLAAFICYVACCLNEICRNCALLSGSSEVRVLLKKVKRVYWNLRSMMDKETSAVESATVIEVAVVPAAPSCKRVTDSSEKAHIKEQGADDMENVLRELVTVCNIMEGSAIIWLTMLFCLVPANPYDVGGEAAHVNATLLHGAMGLIVEVLCDFFCYFIACQRQQLAVSVNQFNETTTGSVTKGLAALGVFTIVLAMCMEAVGHVYEELCPTPLANSTTLKSLSVCP
eukprot:TRINITY_DN10953_c0_g1_i6.p1 TRINITY_DN10953_c0_g1~~TRINITY_DN10953_c0_g1_i6.p1  ORF type:complete len:505 (+),score=89.03 TRINITY_DN10953_c0_g1_i6:139-1653(+)